jgi:valyl-tRNA synthetase
MDGNEIDHPDHYGGADDPYECIKVIEAWGLNFHLGNAVKYINRVDRKNAPIENLLKAQWYITREVERRKALANTPTTHRASGQ